MKRTYSTSCTKRYKLKFNFRGLLVDVTNFSSSQALLLLRTNNGLQIFESLWLLDAPITTSLPQLAIQAIQHQLQSVLPMQPCDGEAGLESARLIVDEALSKVPGLAFQAVTEKLCAQLSQRQLLRMLRVKEGFTSDSDLELFLKTTLLNIRRWVSNEETASARGMIPLMRDRIVSHLLNRYVWVVRSPNGEIATFPHANPCDAEAELSRKLSQEQNELKRQGYSLEPMLWVIPFIDNPLRS
jgi:hypothetical protein